MSIINFLVNQAASLFGGANATQTVDKPAETAQASHDVCEWDFLDYFAEVKNWRYEQKHCILKCVACAMNALNQQEWDFSAQNRHAIDTCLETFNSALDEFGFPEEVDVAQLKAEFMKEFSLPLEEKWAEKMGPSFYPILALSPREERITAAQKWAEDYIDGAASLYRMKGYGNFPSPEFVAKLKAKTVGAFREYAIDKKLQRVKFLVEQQNLEAFVLKMQPVEVKIDNESTSWHICDSETKEIAQLIDSGIRNEHPDIDEKQNLLIKCIWVPFVLQQHRIGSIAGVDNARQHFENIFPNDQPSNRL